MINTIRLPLLAGVTLVVLVALFVSNDSQAPLFQYLVWLGVGSAATLLVAVLLRIVWMWRRGALRSQLTKRLFWMMIAVAVVPGTVIYLVARGALDNTVETYRAPLDSLREVKKLAADTLQQIKAEQKRRASRLAEELLVLQPLQREIGLERLRDRLDLQEVALLDDRGNTLAHTNGTLNLPPLDRPDLAALRGAGMGTPWVEARPTTSGGYEVRALFMLPPPSWRDKPQYLWVIDALPQETALLISRVDEMVASVGQLDYVAAKQGRFMQGFLWLALAAALLAAMLLASLFSDRMVAPLRIMVRGVRSVGRGNFAPLALDEQRDDELGELTRAYNGMTRQLLEQRTRVEQQQASLHQSKIYLESLLESLNTAVVTLDDQLCIYLINRKAIQLLGVEREALVGQKLEEVGKPHSHTRRFVSACALHIREAGEGSWREQVELIRAEGVVMLQVQGTAIAQESGSAYALVLEDVTQLVRAQHNATWGEVAQRMAHEVKNPLTPIQLSVERLQYRLADRLDTQGNKLLDEAANSILAHVAVIKNLVDTFGHYAKLPEPVLRWMDLNALVLEVAVSYRGDPRLELILGEGLPQVNADEGLLNRVMVNLIKNALEATDQYRESARVVVRTRHHPDGVCVCVEDNGPGFSDQQRARLFVPYATTKPKGTGLGLPIVRQIVEAHHGGIEVHNLEPHGAAIQITLPAVRLDDEEIHEQDTGH